MLDVQRIGSKSSRKTFPESMDACYPYLRTILSIVILEIRTAKEMSQELFDLDFWHSAGLLLAT
jgi:hypothetical protein